MVGETFGSFGASVIELGARREVFGFTSLVGSAGTTVSSSAGASVFALGAALGLATFFSLGLASGNAARSFFATGGAIVEDPDLTKTKNQRARYLPAPNRNGKVFVTCSVNGRYGIYPVWWIYNAKKNVFELCCLKRGRNYKLDALIIIKWE